jgi:hypothetical protein
MSKGSNKTVKPGQSMKPGCTPEDMKKQTMPSGAPVDKEKISKHLAGSK